MHELLNAKEAAQYMKLDVKTIYQLTCKKAISYYKPGGKLIFFDRKDLDAYIESKRFSAKSPSV
jgi:excisionase family DNA binding protein